LKSIDYAMLPVIEKRKNDTNELPIQAILLGESIMWTRNIAQIIEDKKFEDFKYVL
jgi:hypothetical protein